MAVTLTLDRCFHDYLVEVAKPNGLGTRRIEIARAHLVSYFGADHGAVLTRKDVRDYRSHRWSNGISDSTVRRELGVYLRAARHAADEERLDAAPALPLPPESEARERWFTEAEVLRILEQPMSDGCRLLIYLALFTGARLGAILALTWRRVDWENGYLDFRVPGERVTKKRKVKVKMAEPLRQPLRRACDALSGVDAGLRRMASGPERGAIYVIQKKSVAPELKRVLRAAGIDEPGVNAHAFKHTFVTWAFLNGAKPAEVSAATGTSTSTLEKHYLKVFPQHSQGAVDAIRISTKEN